MLLPMRRSGGIGGIARARGGGVVVGVLCVGMCVGRWVRAVLGRVGGFGV